MIDFLQIGVPALNKPVSYTHLMARNYRHLIPSSQGLNNNMIYKKGSHSGLRLNGCPILILGNSTASSISLTVLESSLCVYEPLPAIFQAALPGHALIPPDNTAGTADPVLHLLILPMQDTVCPCIYYGWL